MLARILKITIILIGEKIIMRIAFFDTKNYDRESFDPYFKERNIDVKYFESRLNPDTVSLARNFDAVCVFVNDNLTKEVINTLYSFGVKAIFLRCAGFNNVDVKTCFGKIHVYRVPAYSPYAVAEHAMSLLLTSNRRIHKAYNRTRDYNFSLSGLTGFDLFGKTIGVVGTGKIGRVFIDICKGFKMNIIAFDKFPSEIEGVKFVDLETLFKESDIISLHCPLTEETTHLINEHSINLMKKGVIIVNTSRGGLINANDLLQGIKSRKIGAACLDVYEEESDIFYEDKSGHIMNDEILLQLIAMPNVLITSHQAFLTKEALNNIADTTTENIINFFVDKGISNNEVCYHCSNAKQETCQKKRSIKCF